MRTCCQETQPLPADDGAVWTELVKLADRAAAPPPVRAAVARWREVHAAPGGPGERLDRLRGRLLSHHHEALAVRRWGRGLRLRRLPREALEVFSALLLLEPSRASAYSDLAVQRHLAGIAAAPDLLDALLRACGAGAVSLEDARTALRRSGVRQYAVPIGRNGLGDQLMTGAVASRLCEILGLRFCGVLPVADRPGGRISTLFEDPESAHRLTGMDNLPAVGESRLMHARLAASSGGRPGPGSAAGALGDLLHEISRQPPSAAVLCPHLRPPDCVDLCALLGDADGTYLENPFTRTIQAGVTRGREDRSPAPPLFLLHLRLGDVANIEGLVPGAVVVPFIEEPIPLERIDRHPRHCRWGSCTDLAQALRRRFGPRLRLALISDGLERGFQMLRAPGRRAALRARGADTSDANLAAIESRLAERLRLDFADFDECVIGEGEAAFARSLALIREARYSFSTSGHFVVQAANVLRPEGGQPLTFFTAQDQGRFVVTTRRVEPLLLPGEREADIQRILTDVGERLARGEAYACSGASVRG